MNYKSTFTRFYFLVQIIQKAPLTKAFFLKHVEIQGNFHYYPRRGLATQHLKFYTYKQERLLRKAGI